MRSNTLVNKVIFKETASNTSSFTINTPSNANNILLVFDSVKANVIGGWIVVQTAPSSGVFDTSGYTSVVHFTPYNSNAWGAQTTVTSGMPISAQYTHAGQYQSGYVYITDMNTSGSPDCVGSCMDLDLFTYYVNYACQSPTSSSTMIKISSTNTTILSGTFTVYSLV